MKRIGEFLLKVWQWALDGIFEMLIFLSGEDDDDEGWVSDTDKDAICHLCGKGALGHHSKGEFIVCDDCREKV